MDERSRLIPIVVEVKEPFTESPGRPALIEGLFVEVVFASPPTPGAVIIPRSALRPDNHIWVIDADSRIDIRTVEIAHAGVTEAILESGLAVGERICISNLQFVTPGMPVRVEGNPVPEPAMAGSEGGER